VIVPAMKRNPKCDARIALVYRGMGAPKAYRFDHLSHFEVLRFWKMSTLEMNNYLKRNFNVHHRKPRCQKGRTVPENLSYVDIESHTAYNRLIVVVAKWSRLDVRDVQTDHLERFLRNLYPALHRLTSHDGGGTKFLSMEFILHKKKLNNFSPYLLAHVAKWAGLHRHLLHVSDVKRFLEQIYPALKRLALNHKEHKLLKLNDFTKVLNDIWLPMNEPIIFRHH